MAAAVLGLVLALPAPGPAQLPLVSARVLGMGGMATASARGFEAIATNPAGLGMPRPAHLTLTALPVSPEPGGRLWPFSLGAGMRPVTLGDVAEWEGESIPDAVREEWLGRIEAAGRQRGAGTLALTPVAVSRGSYGLQLSTAASVQARLNPDAAELLLFGNAGRTGEPRDFQLAGSNFDAWVVSTAALSGAIPLGIEIGDAPGQAFAAGATLKLSMGHVLFLARDVGTTFAEPTQIASRLPMIQTDTAYESLDNGFGVGLDVGFQWEAGRWGAGLVVRNLAQTFRWKRDDLWFRPGTALFDQGRSDSDFGARPVREAPAPLLESLADFSFGRALALGVSHRPGERVLLGGELVARFGGGRIAGPPLELGAALEVTPIPRLPLQGHLGWATGGVRVGGGAAWTAGRFRLSGGVTYLTAERSRLGVFAASLGGP